LYASTGYGQPLCYHGHQHGHCLCRADCGVGAHRADPHHRPNEEKDGALIRVNFIFFDDKGNK